MRKIILYENDHCWEVAQFHIYHDNKLTEILQVNRFFKVTEEIIFIYETTGGSGYGYSPGQVRRKLLLEGSEFERRPWNEKPFDRDDVIFHRYS